MIGTLCIEISSSDTIISVIVFGKSQDFHMTALLTRESFPYRLMGAVHILS